MGTEILIIVLLILLNGIFSMSEIAIVSARKTKLENAAKRGDAKAKAALDLANAPNKFLSTVQIGITLIGILTGMFGGESIADRLKIFFSTIPALASYSNAIAISLVVLLIGFFSLLFGELIPKRIGLTNPEKIARLTAGPMRIISRVTAPLVWLLSSVSDLIIKLFGIKKSEESVVTEEEIKALVAEGATSGSIDEVEQGIVERVFHLGDRKVGSLMTNKMDIVWLDIHDPKEVNAERIRSSVHTGFPVCDGDIDKMIGIVFSKEIIRYGIEVIVSNLKKHAKPPLFFPENMKAYKALEKFKESKTHVGTVVDEFGSVQGLVTMNDLLEALIDDVDDTPGPDAEIIEREDGSWLVDALLPFQEFIHYFEIHNIDDLEYTGFHTVGGLVLHIAKKLPKTGETFTWKGYSIEVVDLDGRRIDKVLVKKL